MKADLSFRPIFKEAVSSIRSNLQLFSCFTAILALVNYIFLRFEVNFPQTVWLHLIAVYIFYYTFVRVYFWQKPIFEKDNFLRSAGKMLIIILLAFAFVMFLRLGFELMKLFAKSLAVFPALYNVLADTYSFLQTWKYTNIFIFMILFGILMFTIFIPLFAWFSTVIGKEQSIIFSIIETKDNYMAIFTWYLILFGILPAFLTGFMINMKFPLLVMTFVSAGLSILQTSIYLQIYLRLFPLRIVK